MYPDVNAGADFCWNHYALTACVLKLTFAYLCLSVCNSTSRMDQGKQKSCRAACVTYFSVVLTEHRQPQADRSSSKHAGGVFFFFLLATTKMTRLTSTFSTTCLPKEQTLVDEVMIMFSELSY